MIPENTTNKFRSKQNVRLMRGLFFETTGEDKTFVVYSLKDRDHLGYPSLYRLFMEMEDLTEFNFAKKYLDGWEHWDILCSSNWFKPYVERWREELKLQVKAKALAELRSVASDPENKNHYQANKFLIEGGWEATKKPANRRVGRPNKEKENVDNELRKRVEEDFKRMELH